MDNLIASGVVPVYESSKGNPVVDARQLHKGLKVSTKFADWIKDRISKYGFVENTDFSSYSEKSEKPSGGRPTVNYALTLDCAKEISMAESTEQGHKVRQYFIQVEKDYNSPDKIMARALQIANAKLMEVTDYSKGLERQIETDKPKVNFANSVAGSANSILIRELAKMISQNGYEIGEKRLFQWLRAYGYLISKTGRDYNSPSQKSMDMKLMEVKETAIDHASGYTESKRTPLITGKGQTYFVNKLLHGVDAPC